MSCLIRDVNSQPIHVPLSVSTGASRERILFLAATRPVQEERGREGGRGGRREGEGGREGGGEGGGREREGGREGGDGGREVNILLPLTDRVFQGN